MSNLAECDDLQAAVARWTKQDPDFPLLVRAFQQNEDIFDALTACRKSQHLTQREVAQRMGTSQSAIDRVESGDVDPQLSTIQRLAVALGYIVEMRLVRAEASVDVGRGTFLKQLATVLEESR
jgi:transcriptional regulator with XRE-family HTH domain